MSIEKALSTLLFLFWTWRIISFLYTTYTVSETVTPNNAGAKLKSIVMALLMVASMVLHVMPLKDMPRLSLVNTLISIPSQVNTIIFLHKYVGPLVDSVRFTIFLYIMSVLSVLETVYLIYVDVDRME